ncbi:hypothetical protein [Bordetella petrii]
MNKKSVLGMLAVTAALLAPAAMADPWKDESGHGDRYYGGHYHGGDHKEEYWDGHCKVERKWKGNGDYKEERKCKAPRYHQPVVVPGYPVYPAEPGIVIQGTAVIR